MPKRLSQPTPLLVHEIDKLTYRQLQLELKARDLKASGKTEILRERLRKVLVNENAEEDPLFDYLDECSICLEKLSDNTLTTVLTTCSHRYHRDCLKKWFESNSEYSLCCPLCRSSLAHTRHIEQNEQTKSLV